MTARWGTGWRQRLVRRTAWGIAGLLLLWGVAWLAVPPLLKWQAEQRLGAALGRTVTLGAVAFRPWSLDLELRDLAVAAAPSAAASEPQLRLARLHLNASSASMFRRAPVLEALELDGLRLRLTRTASGHYDIDDVLARLFPPTAPAEPAATEPARFALYNVQLRDAELQFDDRPAQRVHRLEGVTLTLPFVSNLPSQVDVTVEPRLAFRLNGAAFDSGAQATPFAQSRRGELRLRFADLDVGPYLGYLPDALPVRLQRGALSADVRVDFALPEGAAPTLMLQGRFGAKDVALAEARAGGVAAPLLGWRRLELGLRDVQPLARALSFDTVRLEGAVLHAERAADGTLNLARLGGAAPPTAAASAASPAAPAEPAWKVAVAALDIADATVRWTDATTRPAAAVQLDGLALRAQAIAWPMREAVPLKVEATLRPQGEGAAAAGRLAVEGRASDHDASLALQLDGLSLAALGPYLAQSVVPAVEGHATARAKLDWASDATSPRLALTVDSATLDGLRATEARVPVAALERLQVEGLALDAVARRVEVAQVAVTRPSLSVARDAQGRWNAARWTVAAPAQHAAAPAPAASAAPWRVHVHAFALDDGRVEFSDAYAPGHAIDQPMKARVAAVRVRLQEATWPGARGVAPARMQVGLRVERGGPRGDAPAAAGTIDWSGRVAPEPFSLSGALRLQRLPVHLFEPYFGDAVPVSLLRAEAGWKGDVALQSAPSGWTVKAGGDARLTDVRVHTRAEGGVPSASDELLSWQAFSLDGLRFETTPGTKPRLEIRQATLNDFYSRLVVTEQGRFNLRDVAGPPASAASAPAGGALASPPASTPVSSSASAPAVAPPGDGLPIDLIVGGVQLSNGRVDFSDHFVRPNYSAALSDLNGRLGAFRSGTRDMATLELRGRAAGTALLDIRGALNPTAQPLALDIQAKATDLELAPLSPYAGKYAGYAIERGKLSMDVAYRIDPDGRLQARNQLVLNQLTFGEKVESPDATKLPVLLAVALLKDRNGVIDINLPISGSINDPQFSVFGLVMKVIGNLLVKAITAPFALLAGGGGEDLSLVEFRPGTATVADAGRATLDKVAKALTDRPGLRMTVTGSADPVAEREAYQRAALQARLLAEHKRALLRDGRPQPEVDAVVSLDGEARAKVLRQVYRASDVPRRPRNAIGLLRDVPDAQMESLLMPQAAVTEEAMRELALQRGLAVRDALIAQGLPSERLFVAAPRLRAAGEDAGAAWTPRVQLTLSTR